MVHLDVYAIVINLLDNELSITYHIIQNCISPNLVTKFNVSENVLVVFSFDEMLFSDNDNTTKVLGLMRFICIIVTASHLQAEIDKTNVRCTNAFTRNLHM